MEFRPQDPAGSTTIPCARSLTEWNWATHLDYYKLCRDSCHNLAQKFLSLLFQLSTFAIGSLTLAGYVREKVRVDTAAAIAVIAAAGTFYFALMLWRYYRIVGELSELCWRMESRMFLTDEVQAWGIFHVIDSRSSFYASKWVRRLIFGYCITLMAAHIVFLTTIWIEWWKR